MRETDYKIFAVAHHHALFILSYKSKYKGSAFVGIDREFTVNIGNSTLAGSGKFYRYSGKAFAFLIRYGALFCVLCLGFGLFCVVFFLGVRVGLFVCFLVFFF